MNDTLKVAKKKYIKQENMTDKTRTAINCIVSYYQKI